MSRFWKCQILATLKTDSMWGDRESARKGSGRCGGKWGPNVSLDQAMGFLSRSGVVMGSDN